MKKAILSLVSGNIISKGLGLFREIIVAALFGTGYINGAYRVAQTGTLVPVNFLVSDSLTAFIPLYKQFKEEDINKAQMFFWIMQLLFLAFSILLTSSAILFVETWLSIIAPGLDKTTLELSKSMIIIMSFGIPLYLSSALINYVEMAHGDFTPMSIRPSIQNFGMLVGALFAYYMNNPVFLAWGFTFAYFVFFCWVLLRGLKKKILQFPSSFGVSIVKEVISNFGVTLRPLILLPFIYQGNIATERAIATLISITAVSALDYAKFITETLLLIVSTPVALAGLATWGGMAKEEIRDKLAVTFELLLIVSVPFSLFLGGFSKDIVTVLFARGQFDSLSIDVTSNILLGMSFGLWAYVIGYVLIKGLNAQLKNKAVLVIMSISLIGNILFNIIAYKYFKETTLGIAYSISGILMCFCCVYNLQLWKDVKNTIFYMSIGAMIYLLMIFFKFHSDKQIVSLILNGLFFIFYWVSFISLISPLREKALTILRRKNKHNVK